MVRDLEKEDMKIRNGNRYVVDDSGRGSFPRDYDRLFLEYTNLRKRIYAEHRSAFSDTHMQNELSSYIDEQFIKLVKEYEVNSPVDFPGYIKKKLGLRVSESFMKSKFKDMNREKVMKEDYTLDQLLEDQEDVSVGNMDDIDLMSYVFSDTSQFTAIEMTIIKLLLSTKYTEKQVISMAAKEHKRDPGETGRILKDLQEYIKNKIRAYNYED